MKWTSFLLLISYFNVQASNTDENLNCQATGLPQEISPESLSNIIELKQALENKKEIDTTDLNDEEKRAIAEVEKHRPIKWELTPSQLDSIRTSSCTAMVAAQNYSPSTVPTPLFNSLKSANQLYSQVTGEEVPLPVPGIPLSAKQVYIGKVFFEEFVLKQKCQTNHLTSLEFSEKKRKAYQDIHDKPFLYADLFNEKGGMNLITGLKGLKYNNQSSSTTFINNFYDIDKNITELSEFKILLEQIIDTRADDRQLQALAGHYYRNFGFKRK